MGLENAQNIGQLNPAWPLGTDPRSEGDDHLRLLKSVLQADSIRKTDDAEQAIAGALTITGLLTLAANLTSTRTEGLDITIAEDGTSPTLLRILKGTTEIARIDGTFDNALSLMTRAAADARYGQLGSGDQTWQDVTVSRDADTNYTNDTGSPIQVAITAQSRNSRLSVGPDAGSLVQVTGTNNSNTDNNARPVHGIIIPIGHVYRWAGAFVAWSELRAPPAGP